MGGSAAMEHSKARLRGKWLKMQKVFEVTHRCPLRDADKRSITQLEDLMSYASVARK